MEQGKWIDGKVLAKEIKGELAKEVAVLAEETGERPGLAVILVGNDPASETYVRGKVRDCEEVGIRSQLIRKPDTIEEDELLSEVQRLNEDPAIHGILVQLPLPDQINPDRVISEIRPDKDVDGFHPLNAGRLATGLDSLLPCTPHGILQMLKRSGVSIAGKHAVVVGRSNIVGKPVSLLLQRENATVTMCHSRTEDLAHHTRQADILVAAVGRLHMITRQHVREGAVVIDVGMNRTPEGKLAGDVDFDAVEPIASRITPVPGGVGPMTRAMLLYNTVKAARTFFTKG
ncbi:MAG: bifunctional methylenetetrahydrofolate dehydrogenase/methenyltetrahydrofolate cyclohydrolase FolD [Firmicutes bacterium]|uniref:Bifunctional protein FolD n=1 Tax=Melghirimyces thermohalophilus TaxID=1236220 RepID=A0A1G6Q9P4_9BACL|nr:bifunctional methylenetetrahydrofolate dehydrogenase/methenyltetrahydrofolate cyclohydrolase FolD [Melghirimyces thermohalophilus]MDA8354457.1 bifunctional methylenetetrahydrofolate dehydrogenase/methenyltetrahydrofolate cyclohydrolase FolD [Bacillota bacterium]SDC88951.1 methylenetetrahydrofolate dehydrogenase (NADP+) / methenyltetrahydrofolate cyclohydrolase [Melghirimyces thermohalophilus]